MGAQTHAHPADLEIARVARRQHGVVARWQLLDAGLTRKTIAVRLAGSRLSELHRGVYLAGSVAPAHAHEMAALLAYRLKATLSHRSATALWNLLPYPISATVWVTIPSERTATRPRIKAIRSPLLRDDIRRRHGMPLTSPARTILDMSSLLGAYELERLVAEAQYRRLVSEDELRDQTSRHPRRNGVSILKAVLDLPGGPRRTRSNGERAMLRLLRATQIKGLETNARIAGYEVDFLWRAHRFAVELDGYDGHSSRVAFERDRLKWARLQARGIQVMPITGRQLRDDPDGVLERLLAALQPT